jgi:hypothetical protein
MRETQIFGNPVTLMLDANIFAEEACGQKKATQAWPGWRSV